MVEGENNEVYLNDQEDKKPSLEPPSLSRQGHFDRQQIIKDIMVGGGGLILAISGGALLYYELKITTEPSILNVAFTTVGAASAVLAGIDLAYRLFQRRS